MNVIELLPGIPGHSHAIDGLGRLTCGCRIDPDFKQIALTVMGNVGIHDDVVTKLQIAEQLRLVWNARGRADLLQLELPAAQIHDAIRALDR